MSSEFAAIEPLDECIRGEAFRRLDSLTKPKASLGILEPLAAQLCAIQRTLDIAIRQPIGVVFAADHGITARGVSLYPREVTAQMVANFLAGGAAISVLARLLGIELWVVDAGVDGDCGPHVRLIDAKIRRGTRDFTEGPAMTSEECRTALQRGGDTLDRLAQPPSNVVVLGEMGIGNTSSAAVLMHGLTSHSLSACVGRGTGLDDAGLERKRSVLAQALAKRPMPADPLAMLAEFGGYEIAMLAGAALRAASRRLLILVDGFTVSIAVALASRIDPRVLDYCVFAHRSAEQGHQLLLDHLKVRPILDFGMRLGEGSGAALVLPQVRAAAALLTGMATFESAGVSDRGTERR